jgi:phage terminase large subunit-like protein
MMARLLEDGVPVVEVRQTYSIMSPAMKATEKAVLDGRLIHGGHPVLRWCFANVPAPRPDPNGNVKPTKSHSRSLKIDGAVATMIAVFLATVGAEEIPLTIETIFGVPADG